MDCMTRQETCSALEIFQVCDFMNFPQLVGKSVETMGTGSRIDLDYPYTCAAGLVGGRQGQGQTSTLCAGKTPAGTYQPHAGGLTPLACEAGHYCPAGSFGPIACPPGTENPAAGAVSVDDCRTCPPGHWCVWCSKAPPTPPEPEPETETGPES